MIIGNNYKYIDKFCSLVIRLTRAYICISRESKFRSILSEILAIICEDYKKKVFFHDLSNISKFRCYLNSLQFQVIKKIMWFSRYISSCEFHEEYRKKQRLLVSIHDLNQFIHTLVWIFRHWIFFRVNEIPCVGLSEWSYFVAGSVQQTSYIIFIHVCFVCLSYIYT